MVKVLLLVGGAKDKKILEQAGFKVATYTDGERKRNSREIMLKLRSLLKECDVVVVNLNREDLPLSEGLLLQLSYNNSTPVLGYGDKLQSNFISTVLKKRFTELCVLIEDLKEVGT